MKEKIKSEENSNHYVLLKRFGPITVNKRVPAHKHQNGLWHVYINEDWHEVPETDIETYMDELKIVKIETDPVGTALLRVEYKDETFEVFYYVDNKDEWHFFYKNGTKPDDIDFEHKLMCSL